MDGMDDRTANGVPMMEVDDVVSVRDRTLTLALLAYILNPVGLRNVLSTLA